MVTARNIAIHSAAGKSFEETRLIDSPEMRLAEIRSSTDPKQIGILRDRLVSALCEYGIKDDPNHPQSCMAIEEALANAIYHGNLGLNSDLKEDGTSTFSDMAKARCSELPWKNRQVRITEIATPYGVWFTISDEGCGFDVHAALQRTIDPEALLASGRGLVMMQAFADELVFNRAGNEVTLVFYAAANRDIHELISAGCSCGSSSPCEASV